MFLVCDTHDHKNAVDRAEFTFRLWFTLLYPGKDVYICAANLSAAQQSNSWIDRREKQWL